MMRGIGLFLAAAAATSAAAPLVAAAPAAVSAPVDVEPARLAVAHGIVAKIFPAAQRDAIVEQMMRPMMANMTQALDQSADMKQAFAQKPELRKAMQDFLISEQERAIGNLKTSLPILIDAMGRAYARRFSLEQLNDIGRFFDTPSGQAYISQSLTMMSDPDIQAAQRAMMMQSLEGMQERVAKILKDSGLVKDSGK
jgi:hypothetical protein